MTRVPDRDALETLVAVADVASLLADRNDTRAQGFENERKLARRDDLADEVDLEERRVRGGAHLADGDEVRVAMSRFTSGEPIRRYVEQQVREAQIRQEVPRRHEPLEMPSSGRLEAGVAVGEVERSRHGTNFESVRSAALEPCWSGGGSPSGTSWPARFLYARKVE